MSGIIPMVRVHSHLTRFKWARLWYLARAYDQYGSGRVEIPTASVWWLTGKARSTMYEWLREGRAAGAFRSYQIKSDSILLYLGSLANVCKGLQLKTWGAVTTIAIHEIASLIDLRKVGVQIYQQEKQRQSYHAAINALSEQERSFFKVADPRLLALKESESSARPGRGEVSGLIGYGPKRVFVSAGFIPVGASQAGTATDLNWSIRTIQRRLQGIDRRQICQNKAGYKLLRMALDYESQEYSDGILSAYRVGDGDYRLFERNGLSSHSKAPSGIGIHSGRFFSYMGKIWLYRCNAYDLDFRLNSMAYRRNSYKRSLLSENGAPAEKEDKRILCNAREEELGRSKEELQEGSLKVFKNVDVLKTGLGIENFPNPPREK